jgi:hypothetical protein
VACESSGVVREAFRARGHDAYSNDLLPADDGSPHHLQEDVFRAIYAGEDWDLIIAHPPCTYLSVSGLHWNKRRPERAEKTEDAIRFFRAILECPFDKIAIENPVGCISTIIRKPDQIVQPYEFGEDASKKTCLWLKGLPPLDKDPSKRLKGRVVLHKGKEVERWSNQTDSGQNRLGPSPDRWKQRSVTYQGIADAMAEKWGA